MGKIIFQAPLYTVIAIGAISSIVFAAWHKHHMVSPTFKIASAVATPAMPPPVISPDAPFVVPQPQRFHPPFDWFSWETFIAMNWPAAVDPSSGLPIRGQPDTSKNIGDPGSRVWETYKTDWETFGNGTEPPEPTPWNSWQVNGVTNPCLTNTTPGKEKVLVMITKMDSVVQQVNEANAGPLIDSNGNYARFEIRLNQTEFDTIVSNKWYLQDSLPLQVTFPSSTDKPPRYGAIELKAAWRELVFGTDDFSRYYHVHAKVLDPGNPPTCREAVMGLIALHLAIKTSPFTEWVWATFEHEDNVPDRGIKAGVHYSLNDGTSSPPTDLNGFNYPPNGANAQKVGPPRLLLDKPLPPDPPVQVTRYTPLDPAIILVNQKFQSALTGTVWAHYELVADQWPTNPSAFSPNGSYPADCGSPFPVDHVANTAAETYFQNTPLPNGFGNSCMQCHFHVAFQDFSWTLSTEAYSSSQGALQGLTAARRKIHNELRKSLRQRFASPSPHRN